MKTNQEYKNLALDRLKGSWAHVVLASIVFFAIALVCGTVKDWNFICAGTPGLSSLAPSAFWFRMLVGVVGMLLILLVAAPLEAGYYNSMRLFYENGDNEVTANMFAITIQNYLRLVLVMVFMLVKVLLWSLLLFVPGVVKAIALSLAPFIVMENPEMSVGEALAESERLTNGHKCELFRLFLSFIGWFILSLLTLGIGFFWTYPYCVTSLVAFYNDLKASDSVIEY